MNRKSIQMMNLKKPRWLTGAIAGTGVFLLAMGILIASRQPQPEGGAVEAMATIEAAAEAPAPVAAPKKTRTTRKAAARPAQPKPAARPAAATAAASEAPAVRLAPADPAPAVVETASAAAYTTITGCLEVDDDQYRLKDTDGENAPRARSWKSGFLKKGSAKVDVVDSANRLRLHNHVGQRVAVTGTLFDRELQARSVQRVSSSCDR